MIVVGLAVLCLGAGLAQYFRVLILIPSTMIVMASVATADLLMASFTTISYFLCVSAGLACALQFGYLSGLILQRLVSGQKKVSLPNPERLG